MLSADGTQHLAVVLLLSLLAALAGGVVAWFRHPHYTPAQRLCYFYGYVMARVLWRAEVRGRLPIRAGTGMIIVCNHRSPYDPAFIQLAAGRVVHWMVAREYCQHRALAWFFRVVQSIPVSRAGNDTAATRAAIRYAQTGGLVGLFPEGRINATDQLLLPGHPGAALIALRARVPVVPCYVAGSPFAGSILSSMCIPAKACLIVGQPIDISPFLGRAREREALDELTKLFLIEIARLAGESDFSPQLAGRHWKPKSS